MYGAHPHRKRGAVKVKNCAKVPKIKGGVGGSLLNLGLANKTGSPCTSTSGRVKKGE